MCVSDFLQNAQHFRSTEILENLNFSNKYEQYIFKFHLLYLYIRSVGTVSKLLGRFRLACGERKLYQAIAENVKTLGIVPSRLWREDTVPGSTTERQSWPAHDAIQTMSLGPHTCSMVVHNILRVGEWHLEITISV